MLFTIDCINNISSVKKIKVPTMLKQLTHIQLSKLESYLKTLPNNRKDCNIIKYVPLSDLCTL